MGRAPVPTTDTLMAMLPLIRICLWIEENRSYRVLAARPGFYQRAHRQ